MIQNPDHTIQAYKNLIEWLTPTNLAEEKERYFSSPTYQPQFSYIWDLPDKYQWILQHTEFRQLLEALHNQDPPSIVKAASKLFHTKVDPLVLKAAKTIVAIVPPKLSTPPLHEIIDSYQRAFNRLGLSDYRIDVVDQHGFNFRPSGVHKKVVMSKHVNLDFLSLEGVVKHELVHLIRYENGLYNRIAASPDYLPTEEGLACYCQDFTDSYGSSSLFQHASEYLTTEVALRGSLREAIDYLQDLGFSAELAWQRSIRHKYGFRDTAIPGDIMKPSMYFYHEQVVKALSQDEMYRLFIGKITVNQLAEHPYYLGKIQFNKLQEFYRL